MVVLKKESSGTKRLISSSLALQNLTTELVKSNLHLSKKIDHLIVLFEDAAKSVSTGDSEEILNLNKKVNELVLQNKELARTLILMENKMKMKPVLTPKELSKNVEIK
tara:strand:- start:161 stop:484 length:324 start_codon:yes stop_codon:yes gene_type:complete